MFAACVGVAAWPCGFRNGFTSSGCNFKSTCACLGCGRFPTGVGHTLLFRRSDRSSGGVSDTTPPDFSRRLSRLVRVEPVVFAASLCVSRHMSDELAQAALSGPLAGGCFCGRLRHQVTGAPQAVNCCHCRDCQRLTGSAFAINAVYPSAQVALLGRGWDESCIAADADGARSWRCPECSVLLFAEHAAFGEALRFVRVGTLDTGERLTPDAHYFVRSKHPWVVIPDGLSAWQTLPPRPAGRR